MSDLRAIREHGLQAVNRRNLAIIGEPGSYQAHYVFDALTWLELLSSPDRELLERLVSLAWPLLAERVHAYAVGLDLCEHDKAWAEYARSINEPEE